jgi:hypothetical protein
MHTRYLVFWLALGCVNLWPSTLPAAADETNDVSFGFNGPETFPIDNFIGDMHPADIDGDGLNEIVVVNNARSKINILFNQTGKTNLAAARRRRGAS